jgi:hypothetical protein
MAQGQQIAQWTMIYYMALDNDLEGAGLGDLREMSYAGSSDQVNYVVQYDRSEGHDSSAGDWTTTRRFLIERTEPQYFTVQDIADYLAPLLNDGSTTDADLAAQIVALSTEDPTTYQNLLNTYGISAEMPFSQEALEDIGEADMGDPAVFEDFMSWTIERYPAEHYMVVISSHGGGWHAIGPDEDSGGSMLELPEIDQALGNVREKYGIDKFDIVGFDACLMSQLEVAAMLAPHANYMIAAQEVIPGNGWEYNLTLNALRDNPAMDAFELGTTIVDNYMEYYAGPGDRKKVDLALVDLTQIEPLTETLAGFAQATQSDTASILSAIAVSRNNTQPFGTSAGDAGEYFSSIDLRGFIELMSAQTAISEDIFLATQDVLGAHQNAVVYARADDKLPGSTGLAIYLPLNSAIYEFANQSSAYDAVIPPTMRSWDDFLRNFHAVANAEITGEDLGIVFETVFTYSGVASVEDMPTVLFVGTGTGVVDLRYAVLVDVGNGLRQIVDVANIAVYETLPEGETVIEYPNGSTNIVYSWPAELPVLTDGTTSGYVIVQTDNSASNQGLVSGTIRAGEESIRANLVFDLDTRELVSIVAFQDGEEGYSVPFEVGPQPGWQFEPNNTFITEDGGEASEPSGVVFTFGDTPLTFYYAPAQTATYEFYMTIADLAGNTQTAASTFEVNNDGMGDWRGFTDTNRGLIFLFPYTWFDFETSILEDGTESYSMASRDPNLAQNIYVNFIAGTNADEVLEEVTATMADFAPTIISETPIEIEGASGYQIEYTYTGAESEHVGIMYALYSDVTQEGYSIDIDFQSDTEADMRVVAEQVLASLRFFEPVLFQNE